MTYEPKWIGLAFREQDVSDAVVWARSNESLQLYEGPIIDRSDQRPSSTYE